MSAKVALITGSTSGIGLAIAKGFAKDGYITCLNSFEPEQEISEIVLEVDNAGNEPVAYFSFDLSNATNGARLVEAVITKFGRLDVLVNNAGVQKVSPIAQLSTSDWELVRTISLDASFETMKASIPDMISRNWGRIINIASAHGLVASPYKSAYVAAKHALIGLTKTGALEVAQNGITVNAICPGYVLTPLVEKQLKDQMKAHNMSEEEVIDKIMLANQPTKQFIEPQEIAAMALYLCSDMARSITGSAISIDGGWTAK
ncbi:MAG: 3-hydroxybutyrate dehydrogenase [Devosiaceae bacterium]|nr:3-hydroxybutyrate dehydrogenase [Devosiaceae bacterium]